MEKKTLKLNLKCKTLLRMHFISMPHQLKRKNKTSMQVILIVRQMKKVSLLPTLNPSK
jgi:hypothetical protein